MQKYVRIVVLCVFLITTLTGCSGNSFGEKGYRTLDYTLVDYKNIPQNLMEQMETKMEEGFELTYKEDEYLYIAKGYGNQGKTRTCVSVEKLYSEGTDIFVKFNIINNNKDLGETEVENTPFLVIKTEYRKGEVHFDEKDEY